MARDACTKIIILTTLLSSFHVKAFSVQTLPQILGSSARRLAPSRLSASFTSSSSSSSSSAASSSSSLSSSVPSSPGSTYSGEATLHSAEISEDYDTHPQYSFSYSVEDLSAGYDKQQEEKRDGDSVQGKYSLLESSGLYRETSNNQKESNVTVSKKENSVRVQHRQQGKTEATKYTNSNDESSFLLPKFHQSIPGVPQNHQTSPRTQGVTLTSRYPASVLGQPVQTTYVDHEPTLFTARPGEAVLIESGEQNFQAFRNTGKTYIKRFQHPPTIIKHRPVTTLITQLSPESETLSLLRDTYTYN